MTDYSVVSATVFVFIAIFMVASLGLFPRRFDPRYITAAMATAGVILLYYIMTFCYKISVELKRLNWFLSGGDDKVRAGLEGVVQAFGQQVKRISKDIK